MNPKRIAKFRQIVGSCGEFFAILISQLDPDAIGAAVLLRVVLESLGKKADIYYAGKISQLNQALFNIFELDKSFTPIPNQLPAHYTLALDDSSMLEDKRLGSLGKINPKIVIDHHRSDLRESDETWIENQSMGSAASIAADLLLSLGKDLDPEEQVNLSTYGKEATLGALGITSDTDAFEAPETTDLDRQMFAALMEKGDQESFTAARKYSLPDRYYSIWQNVLATEKRAHSTLVASGGFIAEEEKDYLARISNKLMRWKGVTLVIVWAIVDDENLTVKARTNDPSLDLNELLKKKFGQTHAGAKPRAGGAERPLEALKPTATSRAHLLAFFDAKMADTFLHN